MTDAKLEVRVWRLELREERTEFRSENIDLDRFFQRYAGQNQFRHHIGTTYFAVQGDRVAGLVTVSSGEMVAEKLAKNLFYPLAYFLTIASVILLFRQVRYRYVADKQIRKRNYPPFTKSENSLARKRQQYFCIAYARRICSPRAISRPPNSSSSATITWTLFLISQSFQRPSMAPALRLATK